MITVDEKYDLNISRTSCFKVAIYNVKGIDFINRDALIINRKKIAGEDAGDPYVIFNFDDVHTAQTVRILNSANPTFEETFFMGEDPNGESEESAKFMREAQEKYNSDELDVRGLRKKYKDSSDSKTRARATTFENFCFVYKTMYLKKLDKKYLTITAYDYDVVGKDDLIGETRVDLLTLASGPVKHNLTLWDGDKETGRIEFSVSMKQITESVFRFEDFSFPAANTNSITVQLCVGGKTVKLYNPEVAIRKSDLFPILQNSTFDAKLSPASFETLYGYRAEIKVYPETDIIGNAQPLAEAAFDIKKILQADKISVKSSTLLGEDAPFSFTLRAYNLPIYVQMKEGVHKDNEVCGGVLFTDEVRALPIPHFSKKESVTINITEDMMNTYPRERKK